MFLKILVVSLTVAAAAANVCKANESKVQKAFEKYRLVPDPISVGPKYLMSAKYPSGAVANLGNVIEFSKLQAAPVVSYTADSNSFYTIVYFDPDHNKDSNDYRKQFLTLLMVNIPGNKLNEGQVIASFSGAPLETCDGYHRFTGLVYKQHGKIHENDCSGFDDRDNFSLSELVDTYHLGDPVAGNFFKTRKEEGCTYDDCD